MELTVCDNCPCLNNDYEQGCWCNLNFDSEYRYFKSIDDWKHCSKDCGLEIVKFANGEFKPLEKMVLEE